MKRETYIKGMGVLFSVFRDLGVTPVAVNAWFDLLKDMSDEHFTQAIHLICKGEKQIYPGTNIVALIRQAGAGEPDDLALRALHRVEKAMGDVGAYYSPIFDDPVIHHAIVSVGGWEAICLMDLKDWKFVRKEFERVYADIVRSGLPLMEPPKLIGTLERSAATFGTDASRFTKRLCESGNGKEKRLPGKEGA